MGSPTSASSASASASASVSASAAASSGSGAAGLPGGQGWNLAWNDEFDGSGLSSSRWTTLNNSTFGDGNQQLECELAKNATVSGGTLSLTARHEQSTVACGANDARFPNGRSYSGATIQTQGKADFTYGYFEIRAKLPMTPGASQGLWPAFWLRPEDGGAGEIDVLETIGTPAGGADAVHQTIHSAYGSGVPQQEHTANYPSGSLSSGYHTYGLDWEPGSISWYIDGKLTWTRTTSTTSWMTQDFSRPYYLRLNFAVGGNWPGAPDASTAFPASYDIDWVRVYRHA
jgi:beta-glucanase (GH16 family)